MCADLKLKNRLIERAQSLAVVAGARRLKRGAGGLTGKSSVAVGLAITMPLEIAARQQETSLDDDLIARINANPMKRAMRLMYFQGAEPGKKAMEDQIAALGPNSGILQQYIFQYARENM